jgi:CHAD domain-containing protein
MREREIKLALPGRFSVPALFVDGTTLDQESLADLNLRATYYDTVDLRLARHGVTLRFRSGESGGSTWTLKLPSGAATDGVSLDRNELHFSGPAKEPPEEARTLVTAYARTEPLVAVATLRTKRRQLHLLDEGQPVAEVAIDEVSVVEGRRVVSRFRELELEDLRGDLPLEPLAEQLRAAGATGAEPIPKVVRALGSRATAQPDITPVAIEAGATLGDAVRASIADALLRIVRTDPLARLGEAEGVHQVRVAFRRLRSDLRTLGDAVDPSWRNRMEPRLRETGAALGAARDLDVLTEHLRADASGSRSALAPLFNTLTRRRESARAQMTEMLNAPEYAQLLDELVAALREVPAGPAAGEAAATALPSLALDAWRRLDRRVRDLDESSPDAAYHRARIAAKRARYAAELASRTLSGKRADGAQRLAARLAGVQDSLGEMQDAAVAEATIRETLVSRGRPASYAFEAGRLVERQRGRAIAARGRFLRDWPDLRRARWRKWAG